MGAQDLHPSSGSDSDLNSQVNAVDLRLNAVEEATVQNHDTLSDVQLQLQSVHDMVQSALQTLVPKVVALLPRSSGPRLAAVAASSEERVSMRASASASASFSPSPSESLCPIATVSSSPSVAEEATEGEEEEGEEEAATAPTPLSTGANSCVSLESQNQLDSASFLAAAETNDTDTLLHLLATGTDFVEEDDEGNMALHLAAKRGHERAVIVLIGAGAPIDAPGDLMRTPLHCACVEGQMNVARRLLMAGAQMELKDGNDDSPLTLAARQGFAQTAWELVEAGANARCVDKLQRTPVMWAAENGHTEVVELLVVADRACVWDLDASGDSALLLAAKARHWDVAELLALAGANPDARDQEGHTAGAYARQANETYIVELLSQSTPVRTRLKTGPLMLAASTGKPDAVRELLWHKVYNEEQLKLALTLVNDEAVLQAFRDVLPEMMQGAVGREALWHAARSGNVQVLSALIDSGVDANVRNVYRNTALHFASYNGQAECVKMLLSRGALVEARGNFGRTPLFDAAEQGHVECVRILVRAGGDPKTKNKGDVCPLDAARSETVRILLLHA